MAIMKQQRFKILDITISQDFKTMADRFEIRYFDIQKPENKYNTIVVTGNSYGAPDMYEVLESVAVQAAQKTKSPDFYTAMYDYVANYLPHEANLGNFSLGKKSKHIDHMHVDITADELIVSKIAETMSKQKQKKLEPGPDMKEIDALPGIHETVKHPVDGIELAIKDIIISLNDTHGWSRERVADWLETLDVDLRFKTEDDKLREHREKKLAELRSKLAAAKKNIDDFAKSIKLLEESVVKFNKEIQTLLEEENE